MEIDVSCVMIRFKFNVLKAYSTSQKRRGWPIHPEVSDALLRLILDKYIEPDVIDENDCYGWTMTDKGRIELAIAERQYRSMERD